ncbi:MAG: 5-oxoprolinase subunit PxpB [Verrucomicrobiaceae bacterium]|nr:5-oxoprolinase subunit PxpB [Verrucomicrobiaceae bacterium]
MEIIPLGDSALLVRTQDRAVPDLLQCLSAAMIPGLVELVPASSSIGVFYDSAQTAFEEVRQQLQVVLSSGASAEQRKPGRMTDIPVCYDAAFAIDLAEVARHTGLTPAEVVQRHSGANYFVSCVGFTPGFPYLSGMPVALATPRRATPRKEVPAGSVAIGGAQTGIYPQVSPGGWNVIGRTPLRLFNLAQDPPALLRAGDRVRFRAITRAEFDAASSR